MNPESERDPHHCDCGKPKMPGETMCRTCTVGGFPNDDCTCDHGFDPNPGCPVHG